MLCISGKKLWARSQLVNLQF